MASISLYIILAIFTIIIFGYWFWFYFSFNRNQKQVSASTELTPGVTIIVCYKNAGDFIHNTITTILHQQYPDFEVIAINDFSRDDGPEKLKLIHDHRLRLMNAEIDIPGKKEAITQAVREAKNDILLFTDADCVPASTLWITSMVKKMVKNEGIEIVLGYGPMKKKDGWLNRFSRFETVLTAMQYFTYADSGIAYMGVGRNLMYRKNLFERISGFESHKDMPSGDDDLLVSQAANTRNVSICLDPLSFMYSEAKTTVVEFLNQKSRHITTSVHYGFLHKLLLSLFAASQLGFYFFIFLYMASGWMSWSIIFTLVWVKWVVQLFLQYRIFSKLDGKDLCFWFPVLEMQWLIYYVILPVFCMFRKKAW